MLFHFIAREDIFLFYFFVIHWLKKQFVCFEYSSTSVESPSINFVFLPYLLYSICFIIYVLYINVRKRKRTNESCLYNLIAKSIMTLFYICWVTKWLHDKPKYNIFRKIFLFVNNTLSKCI